VNAVGVRNCSDGCCLFDCEFKAGLQWSSCNFFKHRKSRRIVSDNEKKRRFSQVRNLARGPIRRLMKVDLRLTAVDCLLLVYELTVVQYID